MEPRKKERVGIIKVWSRDILIAGIIVIMLTTFCVQSLRVVGGSMAPTLLNGQIVIINKTAYKFQEPKQGDIIGFYTESVQEKVVKRIVGMPGDMIDYKDGALYINQVPLEYMADEKIRPRGDIDYPYKVPINAYFVVGDNINSSIDSRYERIGCISKDNIIGKISLRVWPIWIKPLLE